MSDDARTEAASEHRCVEDVEQALDLEAADRAELPGLYRYNVVQVPRLRLFGLNLLLLVVVLHNTLIFGGVDFSTLLPLVIAVELYSLASWGILRAYFTRSPVHLGDVFLVADFVIFDWALYASGGSASLLWPVFVLRTADQLWLHPVRAKVMAALGPLAYGGLLAYLVLVENQPVSWGLEITKLAVLAGMSVYLVVAASGPWHQRQRTRAAKEVILGLESQSRELDSARRRAEEANQAKSQFLARMSHELRTPMNSVVGFTNVLLKNKSLSLGSRDLDYLQRIRSNGQQVLGLLEDLSDLARIEEGEMAVSLGAVDLHGLVHDTVRQFESRVTDRKLGLTISVPAELDPVVTDEARLRRVLVNLIDNAIKFTQDGVVSIVVEADGGAPTALRVEDKGGGIPPEHLATIFSPFEQAEGCTAPSRPGSGLGLAVSHSLCDLMGLELSVESVVGQGSVFTISFPRSATTADGHEGEEGLPPPVGG